MIAAAMLGKSVRYRPSNYHKLTGIAEYALGDFDIQRLDDEGTPSGVAQALSANSGADVWSDLVLQSSREITSILPSGSTFILVDDDQLGELPIGDRRRIPFLERAGSFWGPPSDSLTAIREFERLREAGAGCIIFAWPAFWWFRCYPEFMAYLNERYCCVFTNDRLVCFAVDSSVKPLERGDRSSQAAASTVSI